MHGLIAFFLEVIMLAITHLFIGLADLQVLVVASSMIVALIVSMRKVGLVIIAIALVLQ